MSTTPAPEVPPSAPLEGGRPPSGHAEATRRERRQAWLSSWGTFIAGIAAAIGLILSAVATFVSVAAYHSQSDAAKQQAEDEQMQQVKSVTISASGSKYYVANNSDKPITQISVALPFSEPSPNSKEGHLLVFALFSMPSIPACTVRSIDAGEALKLVHADEGFDLNPNMTVAPDAVMAESGEVEFMDESGHLWWLLGAGIMPGALVSEGDVLKNPSAKRYPAAGQAFAPPVAAPGCQNS